VQDDIETAAMRKAKAEIIDFIPWVSVFKCRLFGKAPHLSNTNCDFLIIVLSAVPHGTT
jgi:hypothetical protein